MQHLIRDEFRRALERELQRRGAAFDLGELIDFLDGAWPLVADGYDVQHWASLFLARVAEAAAA